MTSRARHAVPAALVATLALAGCGAGISYNHDVDASADFTRLRTYSWVPRGEHGRGVNELIERRVMAAIDQALAAKGYQLSGSGAGDFAVNFLVTTREQVDYNTYYTGMGYRGGWYGGMGSSTTRATVSTNGTLVIDIFDVRRQEMIWRGTAQGTVDEEAPPQEREARIQEAVGGTLSPFPSRTPASN